MEESGAAGNNRGIRVALSAGLLVLGAATVAWATWTYAGLKANASEAPPPAAQSVTEAPKTPPRATFDVDTAALIDRYNVVAARVDRTLLLPPAAAMADGGRNEKFHSLSHDVRPFAKVAIEVDNAKARPFSLNLVGATTGAQADSMALLSVMTAIGAAVYGEGNDAGIVLRVCQQAMNGQGTKKSEVRGGFEVFCSAGGGLIMAGINVVDQ